MTLILKGVAVSKGIAIGKSHIFKKGEPNVEEEFVKKSIVEKEKNRFNEAVKETLNQFEFIKNNVNASIQKKCCYVFGYAYLFGKRSNLLKKYKKKY